MFVGFNLVGLDERFLSDYIGSGETIFNEQKAHIEKELDGFLLADGSIDGVALQDDWFPEVDADIFLSHSHGDQRLTLAFAAMLKDNFGLNAFIDSAVWGYADNLLKKIDEEYCKNETGATYDYNKRNFSTSHVHMMLSGALAKMMDKAECLIFINTPNSLSTKDVIEKRTKSPWIYNEIAMSTMLRTVRPERHEILTKSAKFEHSDEKKDLTINYTVDLNHLIKLSTSDLDGWRTKYVRERDRSWQHPLDLLYTRKGVLEFDLRTYKS
ncbi:hypothetical protein [Metabacillus sp. SLBN-84]